MVSGVSTGRYEERRSKKKKKEKEICGAAAAELAGMPLVGHLVRPHWKALTLALLAVLGETLADILEPWPIKIVVDNILQSKKLPRQRRRRSSRSCSARHVRDPELRPRRRAR